MPKIKVILTAGGTSRRFGTDKLFEDLCGKPVIKYSADIFTKMGFEIVIPAHLKVIPQMKELFGEYSNIKITQGGLTRQQSVYRGIKEAGQCDYIIIHDAARPLITEEIITDCLNEAFEKKAVIVAVKTTDTIKTTDINKKITSTLNRVNLINVQTPQIFEYELICDAHEKNRDKSFTDDAALVESVGKEVFYVDGDYSNIKITNRIDIEYAKLLIESR